MAAGATWGRFELPDAAGRVVLVRTIAWTVAAALTAGALAVVGTGTTVLVAVAVAAGAVASRPTRAWLLPVVGLLVLGVTLGLARVGVPVALAAGGVAGFAVGAGSPLVRLESLLAGAAGGGLGHFLADQLPLTGAVYALALGALVGLATAQALLPAALSFAARHRLPPGRMIARTLAEAYRPPCYRAIQLDVDLVRRAPDRETREGLREVAGWVYRLAVTLHALDRDLQTLDPAGIAERQAALAADDPDPFVLERRRSTAHHLDRMLQHRAALAREKSRTASLQEYALAYLEEARAGLALAQQLPAETAPERLDTVLQRLRSHAAEVGARRQTARELDAFA